MSEGAWHTAPERGSQLGMRITAWLYHHARPAARALLWIIIGWFVVSGRAVREASLGYLRRAHAAGAAGVPARPGWRHAFRHELEFARTVLDRVGFWLGGRDEFRISLVGEEHMARARSERRGVVVLGSHFGSFDAMRLVASDRAPLRVNVLMYTAHAARINAVLGADRRDEAAWVRVIPIRPGTLAHVMEAREAIRRGEVVALLADRVGLGEAGRAVPVKFLGETAWLPEAPFRLAAALGSPVVFMVGARVARDAYEVRVAPIADRIGAVRGERDLAIAAAAQRYADLLAAACLREPWQWFNFFDFWRRPEPASPPRSA